MFAFEALFWSPNLTDCPPSYLIFLKINSLKRRGWGGAKCKCLVKRNLLVLNIKPLIIFSFMNNAHTLHKDYCNKHTMHRKMKLEFQFVNGRQTSSSNRLPNKNDYVSREEYFSRFQI